MPLVPADPEIAIRREGTQALVVFSDGERSMGLVVDEIVDIVDDRLEIELAADRSDVVGSAVIRNRATDIVNVAHYLPLAHDDWARPARGRGSAGSPTVLLVDDSAFFREILTPVLKAAGYRVAAAESAERAMALIASGARVDLVVTDIDMPGTNGFDLVAALRQDPHSAHLPVIALASAPTPQAVERARRLAIAEFVAKFDRSGLVAALAETQGRIGEAA